MSNTLKSPKEELKKTRSLTVLKFGGTSVKNIARIQHVADIIKARLKSGPLVVVVSAMGDTTDYLVKLAHQCTETPDKRELDLLLSTGEQISIALLAIVLRSMGVAAKSFTGYQVGIFTENVFSKARIVDLKTDSLENALEKNQVVVIAGFQGITPDGDVTTLGRGGSDTTAVALAAAVQADVCDIYTDVDGVFTADPNSIPSAKLLSSIRYEEVLEMARLGAQVIHPRAVELARQYGVKLRVRNTFKPEHEGTLIHGGDDVEIYRTVSGVAVDKDTVRVSIMDVPDVPGIAGKIMRALADRNIVIDMIMQAVHPSIGLNNVTFTVNDSELEETLRVVESLKSKLKTGEVLYDKDIAKVSLIGASMVGQPGIAATLFESLGAANINIKMIATSEMKLTCVVSRDDAQRAAQIIHDAFELNKVTA
jgi:aspartate kinase